MRIYTIPELEADLKQLEISWDMKDIPEKYYHRQKQFLTDSIIDIQIGATKRKVRAAIEPHWNRVAPKDWKGFQIKLTACRTIQELEALYKTWQQKLSFKNIAELPDLNAKPKPVTRYDKAA